MRPPVPLPTERPFVSFYTPTFRRPIALNACLESVGRQTARESIEHIVVPDHVGYGLAAGLYGRLGWYASALRGKYIHLLCDDDMLASDTVVAQVKAFAETHHDPAVIVTKVIKNGLPMPGCDPVGQPICGQIDLGSYLVRSDIWHAHIQDYGIRYEGDFDHALALHRAGHPFAFCDLLFLTGGARHGRPEIDY